jgi:hypothetical protein
MLNPFFLQGSPGEQNLVQDLINEHLRMFGVEIYYLPRFFLTEKTIIKEVIQSKFDKAYPIEAYVANYEGYADNSDVLSKFGLSISDELSLIISQERFSLYIKELLSQYDNTKLISRPKEGDLIYFPLGGKLFEIKFVETEKPFYQLNKNYVYELRCELFEYEDEDLDTGIDEIDEIVKDQGYISTLTLAGVGSTASALTSFVVGGVQTIKLINDGQGYTSSPRVVISPPTGIGVTATAVATIRPKPGLTTAYSIDNVFITNPGSGYTFAPSIFFIGGGGIGAAATVGIATSSGSIGIITITSGGSGYTSTSSPITFSAPSNVSYAVTATGFAVVSSAGTITQIRITNSGIGYTVPPTITFTNPSEVGSGSYEYNEIVVGSSSSTRAKVRKWNEPTSKLEVAIINGSFSVGENLIGQESGSIYKIRSIETFDLVDQYAQNDIIEEEGDAITDFTERNPFGEV